MAATSLYLLGRSLGTHTRARETENQGEKEMDDELADAVETWRTRIQSERVSKH
jgi:hypothetical protein